MDKKCAACAGPVGRKNTSGYCKTCWPTVCWKIQRSDPSFEQRRIAGINKSIQENPERKQQLKDQLARVASTPHARQRRSEAAKKAKIWLKGNAAAISNPETLARRGRSLSNSRLSWCPRYLRGTYIDLIRSKHLSAAEAKVLVIDQARTDVQRLTGISVDFDRSPRPSFPWGKFFPRAMPLEEAEALVVEHQRLACAQLLVGMAYEREIDLAA